MIVDEIESIEVHYQQLKRNYELNMTKDVKYRKKQLKQLLKGLKEMEDEMQEATNKDLGYDEFTNSTNSMCVCIMTIQDVIDNIDDWNRCRPKDTMVLVGPGNSYLKPEPLGICLAIGSWNFPLFTLLAHVTNAIAAGNVVIAKPSEMAPYCSNMVKRLFNKYMDSNCYKVVEGNVKTIQSLLNDYRWDLILFTGSPDKGKLIAQAAAKHLTPTVLELGGKSPIIVDEDCNMASTIMRLASTKFINAGQICVCPDYIFIHSKVYEQFKTKFVEKIKQMHYQTNFKDYSKIVNEFHCKRLQGLLQDNHQGKVLLGGKVDLKNRFIEPTVIESPSHDSRLMKEEIFGPIVGIFQFTDIKEVIDYINEREKPLTLNYYGSKNHDLVRDNTSSGSMVQNDSVYQVVNLDNPFGGVGNSGYGLQSGREGFDNCCHLKAVLQKGNINCWPFNSRFPPFDSSKKKTWLFLFRLLGSKKQNKLLSKMVFYSLLAGLAAGAVYLSRNYKFALSVSRI